MHRLNSVIAVLCLLVALGVLWVSYESNQSLLKGDDDLHRIAVALQPKVVGSAPNDSPVTVRGGSVENLTLDAWTQPYPSALWVWEDSNTPNTQIAIEGIPNGGTEGIYTSSQISTNWTITLYFRGQDGTADTSSNNWLTICTNLSNYACKNGGTINANTLYLAAVSGDASQFNLDLSKGGGSDTTIDGYSLLRFDVLTCGKKTGEHTRCDHLSQITVAGTGPSFDTTYTCRGGGCDVWIGPPVAAKGEN